MVCSSINVYDLQLNRIGVLYTWVSMYWLEGYNTMGSFQLELQRTDEVMELMQKNRYCGISESDTLMFIESVYIDGTVMIVNGFPATRILTHRVSTEVVSNKDAETALRGLVSAMEPWERVGLGELAGLGVKFTPQTSDGSLEDYAETICQECDLGFRFVHDKAGKMLLFTVYQPPRNANAKYSSYFGNVGDIEYTLSDVDWKNVAVVAGAGEGDERITVIAGDTEATGADRREMYIDARNEQPEEEETEAEYRQRLVEYGEGKLVEQAQIEEIAFNISDDTSLGDVVFVNLPEIKLKVESRVTEVTIQSENNGTTKQISVGTPFNITRL